MTTRLLLMYEGDVRLNFTGPVTGQRYSMQAAVGGKAVDVDEADAPGLLELTYRYGCGCTGGHGNNETAHYFVRADAQEA